MLTSLRGDLLDCMSTSLALKTAYHVVVGHGSCPAIFVDSWCALLGLLRTVG